MNSITVARAGRPRHEHSLETLHSATRAHARDSFNLLASSAGVETRDPLTSRALVDFHFQTPEYVRLMGNEFRLCHRMAMSGMLPEEVRNRDNKGEFSVTLRRYVDDFDEAGSFPLEGFASSWLEPGQLAATFETVRQTSRSTAGLWTLWGLFGCSLVADHDI